MGRIAAFYRPALFNRYNWAPTLLLLAAFTSATTVTAQTFSNPFFKSQDPYVTFWNGNYYYTQSGNNGIQITKSSTLSGLATATPHTIWTSPWFGPDGHANIWAPEIHQVDGRWYIYFAADYQTNRQHRLYVLEGGSDPLDDYHVADTGAPYGQIVESTGKWAIDPNVFVGPDNRLYLTWSCTDDDIGTPPQSLCLAQMKDPLHTATGTVRIATPTESWETRTGPIEEGPVGFLHDGTAYITYSASASWTPNDYSVGVLVNPTGNLLDPAAWVKHGPIFDHHGTAYGPGSVVFVPSADGSELWTLYHGYDRLDCAAWACRSIRAQKVSWDADGLPLIGYPIDPGVKTWAPSGDMASPSGWGPSHSGTSVSGAWAYNDASSADSGASSDGGIQQTFRGSLNPVAFSVSATVQLDRAAPGQYGIFGNYENASNHVEAFIDSRLGLFVSAATVGGDDQGQLIFALPPNFDYSVTHTVEIGRTTSNLYSVSLDGIVNFQRIASVAFGQAGLLASSSGAQFRNITVTDNSRGWGDAFGDSAQGLSRAVVDPQSANGYVHGDWTIHDQATVETSSAGADWHAIYQGNPTFANFTVQATVQLLDPPANGSAPTRFGLIVCHDDRNNQLTLWIDPVQQILAWNSIVRGQSTWASAALPQGFDATQPHTLTAKKQADLFTFSLDGNAMALQRIELANGTSGVVTQSAHASFRNFTISGK